MIQDQGMQYREGAALRDYSATADRRDSGEAARPDAVHGGDGASNTDTLRILWVKVGGLWPVNTGGRLRSFHILSELSRRHEVTVLTTHPPGEDPDGLRNNLPDARRVTSFPYAAPKKDEARFLLSLARSWFSPLPVDLYKNRVPALHGEVRRALDSGEYDLCIADFLFAVPNVPLGGKVPVVFFSHNVEYMIWQRLCSNETSRLRRWLLELEWRKMRRCENAACHRADLSISVSEEDRRQLGQSAGGARIHAIPTGVDIDYYRPSPESWEQPRELVFTGSMDWQPNEDAMLYFIREILPAIRREEPRTTLSIVGRNPGPQLLRLAAEAGVRVTGTVDDIRPYVHQAPVYIVPLRIGGGTRLKIFEALAMGKAVVSTTIGAEGLPLEDGTHFRCADDPEAFATHVVTLLRDADERRRLGEAGRQLVEENFSWGSVAQVFEQRCREALR